jgi:hypothetical protein
VNLSCETWFANYNTRAKYCGKAEVLTELTELIEWKKLRGKGGPVSKLVSSLGLILSSLLFPFIPSKIFVLRPSGWVGRKANALAMNSLCP